MTNNYFHKMEAYLPRLGTYLADYYQTLNVNLKAGAGSLNKSAFLARDILERDRPLTSRQKETLEGICGKFDLYHSVGQAFSLMGLLASHARGLFPRI